MMQSSHFTGDDAGDDVFAVNPFRSASSGGGADPSDPFYTHPLSSQQQQQQQQQQPAVVEGPPLWSQQPPPQAPSSQFSPQQPDPNSGMMGSLPASLSHPPRAPPSLGYATATATTNISSSNAATPLSGSMDRRLEEGQVSSTPVGWFSRCTSCFRLDGYRPYFDLDTSDFVQRFQASLTVWWQPDGFRMNFLHESKPDLYGPLWIALTLVFVLALSANWASYWSYQPASSQPSHQGNSTIPYPASTPVAPFEYDLHPLVRAFTVVATFAWAFPSFLWLASACLGLTEVSWALWVCLYGYSLTVYVPTALLLLVLPFGIVRWVLLACATAASALLVLRNVSGPLVSQDPAKASPIVMSVLGAHSVWFLVLKFGFFY